MNAAVLEAAVRSALGRQTAVMSGGDPQTPLVELLHRPPRGWCPRLDRCRYVGPPSPNLPVDEREP